MSNLFIVATPIGNLKDISQRALETLKRVDFILSEDTRQTQKLLNHFGIKTRTISYHQHSKLKKINYILDLLKKGKNLALVSDAGTPGISDPGNKLIEEVIKSLSNQVFIIPIPGASALAAAASLSGFAMDKFLFLGFPPVKKKRNKFFEEIRSSKYPIILYESPYKIEKTLKELPQNRQLVVCRELTKIYESVYRGRAAEVLEQLKKDKIKGELVVIINK